MLSEQLGSVFSKPMESARVSDLEEFFSVDSDVHPDILSNIVIDREDVQEAIKELKASAAKGPDGIPAAFLKNCKEEITIPLAILFSQSLQEGVVPEKIKLAHIVPIHKGKDESLPANYRLVSLTSHISKTMERVIRKRIVNHLEDSQYFNDNQHRFRSRRS